MGDFFDSTVKHEGDELRPDGLPAAKIDAQAGRQIFQQTSKQFLDLDSCDGMDVIQHDQHLSGFSRESLQTLDQRICKQVGKVVLAFQQNVIGIWKLIRGIDAAHCCAEPIEKLKYFAFPIQSQPDKIRMRPGRLGQECGFAVTGASLHENDPLVAV